MAINDEFVINLLWNKALFAAYSIQSKKFSSKKEHIQAVCEIEEQVAQSMGIIVSMLQRNDTYITFFETIITQMDYKCPISLSFFRHILDYSSIPSRGTLMTIQSILIREMTSENEVPNWIIVNTRLNACLLMTLLVEKCSGVRSESLWSQQLGTILLGMLDSCDKDFIVKIYVLILIETFSMTGNVKKRIITDLLMLEPVLINMIEEYSNRSIELKVQCSKSWTETLNRTLNLSPLPSVINLSCASFISSTVAKQKSSTQKIYRSISDLCSKIKENMSNTFGDGKREFDTNTSRDFETPDAVKQLGSSASIFPSQKSIPKLPPLVDLELKRVLITRKYKAEWIELTRMELYAKSLLRELYMDEKKKLLPIISNLQTYVILNPLKATSKCKLGSNYLEAYNNGPFLESVMGSSGAFKGKWYYEVLLLTGGLMQIGWGNPDCGLRAVEGNGVGDDEYGFSFDTFRGVFWFAGKSRHPTSKHCLRCKAGDVIGSLLDLDAGKVCYMVNGDDIGMTVHLSSSHKRKNRKLGVYPIFSLSTHQHILVNFGSQPWIYPPPKLSQDYKGVNEIETSQIAAIDLLKEYQKSKEVMEDWDDSSCVICYAEQQSVTLLPCKHQVGVVCSRELDKCPLCRTSIKQKKACVVADTQ
ncbi:hypothetical protein BDB01DRAFT_834662 [Pilobolus umbonatus]|nr:hypothetical protein BDB01DRAFT_834662 [Pilobolus umbonatus]